MAQHKMQTIRLAVEVIMPLSQIGHAPGTAEELARLSRAARFKRITSELTTHFFYINAAGLMRVEWVNAVLNIDPSERLVTAVNSILNLQGLRIVYDGNLLSLELISNPVHMEGAI